VAQGIPNPNRVPLSPNDKTLYDNDKDGLYLLAFAVAPNVTLSNRRNFAKYKSVKVAGQKDSLVAEDNGADGIAVDSAGRLYVTTNVGVEVFGSGGELLGVIGHLGSADLQAAKAPERGVRRSGQEAPVHRRRRCRVHGADLGAGHSDAREVARNEMRTVIGACVSSRTP
jgi:hypothetical protein